MIKAEEAREGRVIIIEGKLYKTMGIEFGGAAKAGRVVHLKAQKIETGNIAELTFHGNDLIEEATLDKYTMEYLYNDGENYYFMNTTNYEQVPVPKALIGTAAVFLKENSEIQVEFFEQRAVNVVFPRAIELKVSSTAPGVRDTSNTTFKEATLENGMELLVPQFIEEGDMIRIETATGKYLERVKK
ncbi:elongation factor P [bacterium]|nr:elongation factor P [bacterium]